MQDFDPTDPGTERRRYFNASEHELASAIGNLQDQLIQIAIQPEKGFWLKYWPVFLVVLAFGGSTTTFYYNTLTVGEDVRQLKLALPKLVNFDDMEHELRYRDMTINNLDKRVSEYRRESSNELEKIYEKLDQIEEYLRPKNGVS